MSAIQRFSTLRSALGRFPDLNQIGPSVCELFFSRPIPHEGTGVRGLAYGGNMLSFESRGHKHWRPRF